MKQDIYWIGPCPAEEEAVQIGDADYATTAKGQCRKYIEAIRQVCGPEPEGARLTIKSQPHDFGSYYEVAVVFDGENEAAAAYAAKCDEHAPTTWPEPLDNTIRFKPGTVVATVGATMLASRFQIHELLRRHLAGDWGDLSEDDKKANEHALKHGERILSSYRTESGEKLWVITEASRESTCVMTPNEY